MEHTKRPPPDRNTLLAVAIIAFAAIAATQPPQSQLTLTIIAFAMMVLLARRSSHIVEYRNGDRELRVESRFDSSPSPPDADE